MPAPRRNRQSKGVGAVFDGDMTSTLLLSVDPSHNRYRFFRVELTPRECEGVELHRRWGRIGSDGRHAVERFPSPAAARAAHEALLALRSRRGYVDAADEDLARALRLMAHGRAGRRAPRQLQFPNEAGF